MMTKEIIPFVHLCSDEYIRPAKKSIVMLVS